MPPRPGTPHSMSLITDTVMDGGGGAQEWAYSIAARITEMDKIMTHCYISQMFIQQTHHETNKTNSSLIHYD